MEETKKRIKRPREEVLKEKIEKLEKSKVAHENAIKEIESKIEDLKNPKPKLNKAYFMNQLKEVTKGMSKEEIEELTRLAAEQAKKKDKK